MILDGLMDSLLRESPWDHRGSYHVPRHSIKFRFLIWYFHLVRHHLKPINPNFYCIWLSRWKVRSILLSTTNNIFWKKKSKMNTIKLKYYSWQEINEIFSVIYQKIEREKLNKMVYSHIIFQWTKLILLVKYYRWLAIFRIKNMWIFSLFYLPSSH